MTNDEEKSTHEEEYIIRQNLKLSELSEKDEFYKRLQPILTKHQIELSLTLKTRGYLLRVLSLLDSGTLAEQNIQIPIIISELKRDMPESDIKVILINLSLDFGKDTQEAIKKYF